MGILKQQTKNAHTSPPPPKKKPYEISEDLKIMGIRNLHTVARDRNGEEVNWERWSTTDIVGRQKAEGQGRKSYILSKSVIELNGIWV